MRRHLCILDPLGKVFILFGVIMLIPWMQAWIVRDMGHELAKAFAIPGFLCIIFGACALYLGRNRTHEFKIRHASLLVLTIWFCLPVIGAYPLITFTNDNFIDAYFEAVSGLTASGATILVGIDVLPDEIKLWRGLLSWMGGLGLIVLAVAILPNLGVGGRQMMRSEITGPLKDNDLTPQINETAKGLWLVYVFLTILCCLAYWLCGMRPLDAVVHSFTTLGLGGFSNHDASFAYFESALIETVAIVFMLIAGFNFATHFSGFMVLRQSGGKGTPAQRSFKQRLRDWRRVYTADAELPPYLITLLLGCVVTCTVVLATAELPWVVAVRQGIFNTVSVATTTGYTNADYGQWPLAVGLWMLLLANFASCSGSTGGGIKMIRALTLLRILQIEQTRLLHPSAYLQVNVQGRRISSRVVASILFFVLAYVLTIFLTTLLMLAVQPSLDLLTAFSAAVATVSNTGPGLGDVGPASTYASLNPAATALGALAMLLGRLELLLFLLLFSRSLWR